MTDKTVFSNGAAPERLLEVQNVTRLFPLRRSPGEVLRRTPRPQIRALDGVSITISQGEALGVVGESGCGKSTLGRLLVRLDQPTTGEVLYRGQNLADVPQSRLRVLRRSMQMVFQDSDTTLNPRMRVGRALAEVLRVHRMCPRGDVDARVLELLELVGLPSSAATRYPAHLSGGQRQRIGIARALAVQPELIVADEPVSALDVSVQAQILNLLITLKRELQVAWVFIGHNLATVLQVADRVAVIYLGRVVEHGPAAAVLTEPLHPYTKALLLSVPRIEPTAEMPEAVLAGDPPSPINIPPGCRFASRCPLARPYCRTHDPALERVEPHREVACWHVSRRDAWEASS